MSKNDESRLDNIEETGEDAMKVPIDEPASTPEDAPTEADAVEFDELDEEAMVEAAIRAGDAAAEEDFANDINRVKAERDELYQRLEECTSVVDVAKQQAKEASDRFVRLQADWENFRRRMTQEREVERSRAAERLVTDLLPVLDDMERAVDHARQTAGEDDQLIQFADGVSQIHDKMVGVLAKEGVKVIDPAGEPFDPMSHQAVGRVEDTEAFDETVAQVYQRGYSMGGKVIRSAMVTVTYGGPKRPTEEDAASEE